MRFRKSIKLMKGVKLNFSQSGVSLTAGVRGASVNFGPRGTYLNTGIPGTGLYERTRLSTDDIGQRPSSGQKIQLSITVGIEDDGSYFIKDKNGNPITDESILRKIKRTEAYKLKIQELSESFISEKTEENEAFINIYKLSPALISESDVKIELERLQPLFYKKRIFDESAPRKDTIELELQVEANQRIR